MNSIKVYDKVPWHYPDGEGCPNIESAKRHFAVMMNWLKERGLLTDYGKELFLLGIGSDFALTSEMVTAKGAAVLDHSYEKWLKTIGYDDFPGTELLDRTADSL